MNRTLKIATFSLVLVIILSGCLPGMLETPTTSPDEPQSATPNPSAPAGDEDSNPFAPKPGDEDLDRQDIQPDEKELRIMESYPVQVSLHIAGNLPNPCHQLRVKVPEADEDQNIDIEVYSVVDPDQVCAQVLEPFDANVPVGTFEEQGYTFLVNGEKVGEY